MTLELQRSSDNSNWNTIKSWTKSGSGQVKIEESYYVTHGYYYRCKLTVSVLDSSGNYIETVSKTTGGKYY